MDDQRAGKLRDPRIPNHASCSNCGWAWDIHDAVGNIICFRRAGWIDENQVCDGWHDKPQEPKPALMEVSA